MGAPCPADDPSWHRKAQRRRQTARAVVQAADSCIRNCIQLPQRLRKRLAPAAAVLDHNGSKVPSSVAVYLQDMGGGQQQNEKSEDEGWTIYRKERKPKVQWAEENEAEKAAHIQM